MKPSLTTRICSRVPTLFAVALCALFLSGWYAARLAGEAMLPAELGGPAILLFMFSPIQNLRNDIRRSRFRSAAGAAEKSDGKTRFRAPYVLTLLPTFVFFQSAVFVVLGGGMASLFLCTIRAEDFLVLAAVSFAVAFLNSWNDREHAAALRASVPPPLPPRG